MYATPAVTSSEAVLSASDRSAKSPTCVSSSVALTLVTLSPLAVAVLLSSVSAVVFALIVTSTEPPLASVPTLQVTVPLACVQVPAVVVFESHVRVEGSGSVITTFVTLAPQAHALIL